MGGRKLYRAARGELALRIVEFAGGTPSGPAWPAWLAWLACATGGVTRGTLPPGNADATWLNAGAEEVQP
jgi:hypothetical protein